MAARTDQVIIEIQTIGAAAARRDINSLARATNKLNDSLETQKTRYQEATSAVKEHGDAHQSLTDTLKAETKVGKGYLKQTEQRTRTSQAGVASTKKRIKATMDQVQAEAKLNDMIKEGNKGFKLLTNNLDNNNAAMMRVSASTNATLRINKKLASWRTRQAKTEAAQSRAKILAAGREARAAEQSVNRQNIAAKKLAKEEQRQAKRLVSAKNNRKESGVNVLKEMAPQGVHMSPYMVGLMGAIAGGIDLIPILATGLSAVAAGGIAAVHGLSPLVGMLGAIPPALVALGTLGGILRLTLGGNMAKALQGDARAFSMLGPNAQKFAFAIRSMRLPWMNMTNSIREGIFTGLASDIQNISSIYLPYLNQMLRKTASGINIAAKNFGGWMQSRQGQGTIKSIGNTDAYVVSRGVDSAQIMLQTLLLVTAAAGPMIRQMTNDVLAITMRLNNWVNNNQSGIGAFFSRSYSLFKSIVGVLKDYGTGVYNILAQSTPLADHIGKMISQGGKDFLKWTVNNKGGIAKYFTDMQKPLDSVIQLAGAVAKGIFQISNQPGFVKMIDRIRKEVVPDLVKFFQSTNGEFLNIFIQLIDNITKMAQSGALQDIADVASTIAGMLSGIANVLSKHPGLEKFMIWAIALSAVFGGILGKALSITGAIIKWRDAAKVVTALNGGSALAGGAGTAAGAGGAGGYAARHAAAPEAAAAGGAGAGVMGLLGPIAAAFAIAVGGGALANKIFSSSGRTDQSQQAINKAVAAGNLSAPFRNKNGKGVLNAWDLGGPGSGVNSISGALNQYQAMSGWRGAGNAWIQHHLPGWMGGGQSNQEKIAQTFKPLDQSLSNLAKSGNAQQAATDFAKIQAQAKILHMSMKDLNALFPTYNAYLQQQKNIVAGAGTTTPPGADNNLTYMDQTGKIRTAKPLHGASAMFAGGIAQAGQNYITGEVGPELAIGRDGSVGMLGLNGMEAFRPRGNTAIIPASATADPINGNYGNAPGWAKEAMQSALAKPTRPVSSGGGGGDSFHADIKIGGDASGYDMGRIKSAVFDAFKSLEQDRKERR